MHNRTGHAEDYKQEPRTDTRRLIQFPEFPQNATLTVLQQTFCNPPSPPDIYIQRYTEGKQAGCTMFRSHVG